MEMNIWGKTMNKKILKLLYRSFDDKLGKKEQERLANALEKSQDLSSEKKQIEAQRRAIAESADLSFKPFFAERVINRIGSLKQKNGLETFYEQLKAVFRRIILAGAIVLIVLLTYNLGKGDSLSLDEVFYTSDLTFEEILDLPLF